MTTANKITIGRILLIPFFISQVLYYTHYGNEQIDLRQTGRTLFFKVGYAWQV